MQKIDITTALNEVRVFTEITTVYGIPSTLFVSGLVMSVMNLINMPLPIGAAMAVLMMGCLYQIHTDDPKALAAWFSVLFSPKKFCGGIRQSASVVFI